MLDTGRTHQIRVHAQHAGHPVAGDTKYGDADFNAAMRALGLKRMFLHASSVSFPWPEGGEFSINTPLPAELAAVLEQASRGVDRGRAVSGQSVARARAARPASQMSGSPMRAVGSWLSMYSNSVIPRASALKPPAQSNGCSRAT